MSEAMVLLEFAGQPLALTQAAFLEALQRGREMVGRRHRMAGRRIA